MSDPVCYAISGELSPDCTVGDTGESAGTVNGQPYWEWVAGGVTYYLCNATELFGVMWGITTVLGSFPQQGPYWMKDGEEAEILGDYAPGGGAAGTATVTVVGNDPPAAVLGEIRPVFSATAAREPMLISRRVFDDSGIGRTPIGIAQSRGYNYPLIQPSADIQHLVADFYFQYRVPEDIVEPVSIAWLYGLGTISNLKPEWAPDPVHNADILLRDSAGNDLFDSTKGTYLARIWTPRLFIHQWITDTAICRMVAHTQWPPEPLEPTPRTYTVHIVPQDGRIDPRTVVRVTRYVTRLIVHGETVDGDVVLQGGYNTVVGPEATQLRGATSRQALPQIGTFPGDTTGRVGRRQRVAVSAVPGSGMGRQPYPGVAESPLLRINGVGPDANGNFRLEATGCYWLAQPTELIVETEPRQVQLFPSELALRADCPPCCDCPEFVEVKLAIDSQWAEWMEHGANAEAVRDMYVDNRERWLEQKACREANPQRLDIVLRGNDNVAVTYAFCHTADECAGPLSVFFEFRGYRVATSGITQGYEPDITLVPSHTMKNEGSYSNTLHRYTPSGGLPELTAHWEFLDAHKTAKLHLAFIVCNADDGDTIRVRATPTFRGETLPTVTRYAALVSEVIDDTPVC